MIPGLYNNIMQLLYSNKCPDTRSDCQLKTCITSNPRPGGSHEFISECKACINKYLNENGISFDIEELGVLVDGCYNVPSLLCANECIECTSKQINKLINEHGLLTKEDAKYIYAVWEDTERGGCYPRYSMSQDMCQLLNNHGE